MILLKTIVLFDKEDIINNHLICTKFQSIESLNKNI